MNIVDLYNEIQSFPYHKITKWTYEQSRDRGPAYVDGDLNSISRFFERRYKKELHIEFKSLTGQEQGYLEKLFEGRVVDGLCFRSEHGTVYLQGGIITRYQADYPDSFSGMDQRHSMIILCTEVAVVSEPPITGAEKYLRLGTDGKRGSRLVPLENIVGHNTLQSDRMFYPPRPEPAYLIEEGSWASGGGGNL